MERLLQSAHLSSALLERPEMPIPFHLVGRLLEAVARREGLADLGVLVGRRTGIEALGEYGLRILASTTLADAIEEAARTLSTFCSAERLWMHAEDDRVWLRVGYDRRIERGRAEIDAFTVMILVQLVQRAAGPAWRPLEIEVGPIPTPTRDALSCAADAPVCGDCAGVGIALEPALLRRRLPALRPAAQRASGSDRPAERTTGPPPISRDLAGSVEQVVEALLLEGYPDIHVTAEAIGFSVRTLQRRLGEVGLAYGRLVERIRYDAAVRLLADRGAPITDIAIRLGYSDPANFTHAFRRWTGVSPRAYRDLGVSA